jgi:Zn-dependent protease
MFGIHVRVHPLFWLVTVFMGWNTLEQGFEYLFIWIACVFVSILVHEMGHVVMARVFGERGHIVLYSFGGLAVNVGGYLPRWQRICIALAGPFAGFLFLGVVMLIYIVIGWQKLGLQQRDYLEEVMWDLYWINLAWGLMNLLPVWPLDGGHVSRDIITWFSPRNGVRISLILSIVVACLVSLNAILEHFGKWHVPYVPAGGWYVGILFAVLAINNGLQLQFESQRARARSRFGDSDDDERMPWERDPDWWKKR